MNESIPLEGALATVERFYKDTQEDRQKYFNKTVEHLMGMKGPAYDGEASSCSYLSPTGAKCAVGVHLPDGHPAQTYKGYLTALMEEYPELEGIAHPVGMKGFELARRLQTIHDSIFSSWNRLDEGGGLSNLGVDRLRECAEDFGLDSTVIDMFETTKESRIQ